MNATRWIRQPKIIVPLAAALVITGAGMGIGAYALFDSTSRTSGAIAAGSVDLDWASTTTTPVTVPIGPLTPGGTSQQLVDLRNVGTVSVTEMQLAYTGAPGTPAGDYSDGIQLRLEKCSLAWTGTPESTSCPGETTELVGDRPVTGRTALTDASSRAVGGVDHLRFTFRLPDSSPYSAVNTTGNITFEVLGNQRPGEYR